MIKKVLNSKSIISLAHYCFIALAEIIILFIMNRSFNKTEMGSWVFFISVVILFEAVRYGFISTPLIYYLNISKDTEEREGYIGSSWVIGLVVTVLSSLLIIIVYVVFRGYLKDAGYEHFFMFYPLVSIFNLPQFFAISIFMADLDFKKVILVKAINYILFIAYLFTNYFLLKNGLYQICIIYTLSFFVASLFVIFSRKSGISCILKSGRIIIKDLLNYGKYCVGTTIGSNLLRHTDIFLIGIFLSKAHVAIYNIPMQIINVVNIPIMSFSTLAFPKICNAYKSRKFSRIIDLFSAYTITSTAILIPFFIIIYIFSNELITIVGGEQYVNNPQAIRVLRIFILFGLLSSIDRFTGAVVSGINRPDYDFQKVVFMALFNLLGDIFVLSFYPSLEGVALVTFFNVLFGTFIGVKKIKREIKIPLPRYFFKNLYIKNNLEILKE